MFSIPSPVQQLWNIDIIASKILHKVAVKSRKASSNNVACEMMGGESGRLALVVTMSKYMTRAHGGMQRTGSLSVRCCSIKMGAGVDAKGSVISDPLTMIDRY
jgi:hypothetical protein